MKPYMFTSAMREIPLVGPEHKQGFSVSDKLHLIGRIADSDPGVSLGMISASGRRRLILLWFWFSK